MEKLLIFFIIQGFLGAFDTIYHHELKERLPWRRTAYKELILHGVRGLFYSVIFISLAWISWDGAFTWAFTTLLLIEVVITLWDFVEEDKTRKLPASERITHTILALNYGIILALLAPILWQWSQYPTGFRGMNYHLLSWIMSFYAAGVLIWGCRDLLRGLALSKKLNKNVFILPQLDKPKQRILITGGTGFVGTSLCQALIDQGHHITIVTRNMERAASLFSKRINLIESIEQLNDDEYFDVIVNLAGETISQRWSEEIKGRILSSRINITNQIISFIKKAKIKPSVLISGSAIGIYGTSKEKIFTEASETEKDIVGKFPRDVCLQWEETARQSEQFGVRICLLRMGVVLGSDGGALASMLFPFECGLGGRLGSGKQWFSWIHRDDLIRIMIYLMNTRTISGPVNAVAPEPVTNNMFSKALGKALKRPVILPFPAFQVKLLFGEMGKALLLSGQKVLPQKLTNNGFKFLCNTIDESFEQIFME